jgi:serine protease Do
VRRGTLGYIEVAPVTTRVAEQLAVPAGKGVLVSRMSRNSSAYEAGIRPGDVIVGFNGRIVEDSSQLLRLVADSPIGSTVTVSALREGRKVEFRVPVVAMRERPSRR